MRMLGVVALSILFGLLFLLIIRAWAPVDTSDVAGRGQGALHAAGLGWADVSADGRDVALLGVAPSETARMKAEDILRRVPGVRSVDNQATLARLAPVGAIAPSAAESRAARGPSSSEIRPTPPAPLGDRASCTQLAGGMIDDFRVPFYGARYNVNAGVQPALESLASALGRCTDIRVEIAGHTDSKGPAEMNERLSLDRARSVLAYLVDAGIDPNRLSIVAHGEARPIADNGTEEGRAENRRIEFRVLGG